MVFCHKFMPLNNGFKIPVFGFIANQFNKQDIEKALLCAIDAGYRYIDCNSKKENEHTVGLVLKMKMGHCGLTREDFCIASNVWCTENDVSKIQNECKKSLQNLGVKYLDLYLVHWPNSIDLKLKTGCSKTDNGNVLSSTGIIEDTWREMEKLVDAGLVKSIGLSNFNQSQIEQIIKICYIKPVMLQIESSLTFLNQSLVEYAHSYGIQVTSVDTLDFSGKKECISPFLNEHVMRIAKIHRKSPSQILIRHALQRELVVLVNNVDPEQIRFNLNVFDFELKNEEMEQLNNCGSNTSSSTYRQT